VVTTAIGDFTTSLWQAIAIILAVSFLTLGVRPGAVVAVAIPVTLAAVFLVMQTMGIDLHRVSLGALIIALALLVDDAMTTTDAMLRRLAVGDTVDRAAATFAYSRLAAPMLTGSLITIAGFVPIGFAESQGGEYTVSLFQVVAIALIASWLVAVLFTPIIGSILLKTPRLERAAAAGPPAAGLCELPEPCDPRALDHHRDHRGHLRLGGRRPRPDQPPVLPALRPQRLIVDFQLPRSSSIFASETAMKRIEDYLAASADASSGPATSAATSSASTCRSRSCRPRTTTARSW
jgi:multidrug efflux pump